MLNIKIYQNKEYLTKNVPGWDEFKLMRTVAKFITMTFTERYRMKLRKDTSKLSFHVDFCIDEECGDGCEARICALNNEANITINVESIVEYFGKEDSLKYIQFFFLRECGRLFNEVVDRWFMSGGSYEKNLEYYYDMYCSVFDTKVGELKKVRPEIEWWEIADEIEDEILAEGFAYRNFQMFELSYKWSDVVMV